MVQRIEGAGSGGRSSNPSCPKTSKRDRLQLIHFTESRFAVLIAQNQMFLG
jgi:hypothetical protein